MKNIRRIFQNFLLLLVATLTIVTTLPPSVLFAQNPDEEAGKEAGTVTLEEYYREINNNFFGQDLADCGGSSAGAPANISVGKDFSLGTDAKERRVNLLKALMRDFGLTPFQAAGIVGNFMQESGGEHLPPDVNQGDTEGKPPAFSGGYGWAQWTGSRQREFIDFAVENGYMASRSVKATDAADYAWLTNELTTGYASTIVELKKAKNLVDAAVSFHQTFEKSSDTAEQIGERGDSAVKVLREYAEGGGGAGPTGPTGSQAGCGASGDAALVGDKAFPLITTKADMNAKNPGLFANNTTGKGGHPYTAFDILADPDTQVVAFMSGTVTMITEDRCPGRMISVFNKESNVTISYLHMNMNPGTHIANGKTVKPGDAIGLVGPPAAGCGTPHLHIDAARGSSRPGCSRLECPTANASKFIDIGPDLFSTFQALKN